MFANNKKFFITVATLAIIAIGSINAQPTCGNDPVMQLDELIAGIAPFGNPKVHAPVNQQELPRFCSYYANALKQISEHNNRCVTGEMKAMVNGAMSNIRKNTKELCSKQSLEATTVSPRKAAFFQIGKCISSGSDKLKQCAATSKVKLDTIPHAEQAKRIPLLCCEMIRMKDCLMDTINQQTGCTGDDMRSRIENFVSNFGSSGVLQSTCAPYRTNGKCATLSYPKRQKSQRSYKSIMMPVLTVMTSV